MKKSHFIQKSYADKTLNTNGIKHNGTYAKDKELFLKITFHIATGTVSDLFMLVVELRRQNG